MSKRKILSVVENLLMEKIRTLEKQKMMKNIEKTDRKETIQNTPE